MTQVYVSSILSYLSNPQIIHVVVPVLYNICMDYGMGNEFPDIIDTRLTGEESRRNKRLQPTGWSPVWSS